MTALVAQLVNAGGSFMIGILLFNPNGTIGSSGGAAVTPASNTAADIRAAINTATIGYAAGQGYTISASDVVSTYQSPITRTFTNPTRSLNTAFQISSIQDVQVSYAVDVATALSLTSGQTGTVVLEYADDSGFTVNVTKLLDGQSSLTGTLVIGLGLNPTNTVPLYGTVPAGKYVRLRTVNTTGTPTFTFRYAQEVLL